MVKRILVTTLLITQLLSFSACNRSVKDAGGAAATEASQATRKTTTVTNTTTETETTAVENTTVTTVTTAKPTTTTTKPAPTTTAPKEPETVIVEKHDNIKTAFDTITGVLAVSGEGVVENLYPHHENDQEEYDNITVKKLIIGEGITYVKNAFNHLIMLESIELPSTLHTIEKSFIECGNTEGYWEGEEWKPHKAVDVTIPATVKKIFNQSFEAAVIDTLVFEGPIEISCPGSFDLVTIRNQLLIPAGSVLCDAFDNVIGEKDLVLGAGVVFPDHEQHACDVKEEYRHDEDNYSFTGWGGHAKTLVCLPLYNNGSEMTAEEIQDRFFGEWFPVIVPTGESIADYEDSYERNENWHAEGDGTAWYPWEYRDALYPRREPPFV